MRPIAEILREASERLEAVTGTPRLDAELLLAHALGIGRPALLARLHEPAPEDEFLTLLARRAAHEPIAYILGEWEFFSLTFRIRRPMLVPRPETEHVVEEALRLLHMRPGPGRVLDLCTGTGCIAVAVARNAPGCDVLATDIHGDAVALARENALALGVAGRMRVMQGDLFGALPADSGPFDAVCANPPYVSEREWASLSPVIRLHEDPKALLAGERGLDVLERLVPEALAWLAPGGGLFCEIGEDQRDAVQALALDAGYDSARFACDLAGRPRVLVGIAP